MFFFVRASIYFLSLQISSYRLHRSYEARYTWLISAYIFGLSIFRHCILDDGIRQRTHRRKVLPSSEPDIFSPSAVSYLYETTIGRRIHGLLSEQHWSPCKDVVKTGLRMVCNSLCKTSSWNFLAAWVVHDVRWSNVRFTFPLNSTSFRDHGAPISFLWKTLQIQTESRASDIRSWSMRKRWWRFEKIKKTLRTAYSAIAPTLCMWLFCCYCHLSIQQN